MPSPIRILTAVPICDGHDSAINTINLEFIRHGIEVIYLGYHRSARDIVRAAIQEDVRAIGLSSYNGGHVEFFAEVIRRAPRVNRYHLPALVPLAMATLAGLVPEEREHVRRSLPRPLRRMWSEATGLRRGASRSGRSSAGAE